MSTGEACPIPLGRRAPSTRMATRKPPAATIPRLVRPTRRGVPHQATGRHRKAPPRHNQDPTGCRTTTGLDCLARRPTGSGTPWQRVQVHGLSRAGSCCLRPAPSWSPPVSVSGGGHQPRLLAVASPHDGTRHGRRGCRQGRSGTGRHQPRSRRSVSRGGCHRDRAEPLRPGADQQPRGCSRVFIKATDLGDGRTYSATVLGYDTDRDVALIQLRGASRRVCRRPTWATRPR